MQTMIEFGNNELVYDNTKNESYTQSIIVSNDTININYNDIIDTQFTGGNVAHKLEQLKSVLNLGVYSRAPCGGFVNFFKITSRKGNSYYIYSGINEVSNSHYIITIYKIFKD